jgi:hypothetical protein
MSGENGDPRSILGWGIDIDPRNNPTYPQRDVTKDGKGGMSWERPTQQVAAVEILMSTERPSLSAVFGTGQPPRGLSGIIRRRAFKKSEGKWGHWLMLMAADRIDVVEGVLDDLRRGRIRDLVGRRRSVAAAPVGATAARSRNYSLLVVMVLAGAAILVAAR